MAKKQKQLKNLFTKPLRSKIHVPFPSPPIPLPSPPVLLLRNT